MIAAMRPSHAYQQTSSAHSRPNSRNSSHSNSSAVASPSNFKSETLAARAANNAASNVSGKRASTNKKAAKSQEPERNSASPKPVQTPGLITLTKPLSQEMQSAKPSGPTRSKKAKESNKNLNDNSTATPIKNGRSKRPKSSPKSDPSLDLLSKSAPSAPVEHNQRQSRAQGSEAESSVENSGLTWQQEMFASNNKTIADLTNGRKSARKGNQQSVTKHDGNLAQPQKVGQDSAALTWQQELFGSQKHGGTHADVFADARDAETFGDEPSSNTVGSARKGSKRRPRAGSFGSGNPKSGKAQGKTRNAGYPLHVDDVFDSSVSASPAVVKTGSAQGRQQYPPHEAPIHFDPSTPAKKIPSSQQPHHPAVAAAIAYAGPNFHNSPSPASLPAPKFQSRLGKGVNGQERSSSVAAGSSSGDSSASDGESELVRGVRGSTAPAQIVASSKEPVLNKNENTSHSPAKPSMQPGATVESLLARMMGGARFA